MLGISGQAKYRCFREPIDLRKGCEKLLAIVKEDDILTKGSYFVFINRPGDKMKVLYWDGDGIAIWYKRLAKGSFNRPEEEWLDKRSFSMLLEGVIPKRLKKRYKIS